VVVLTSTEIFEKKYLVAPVIITEEQLTSEDVSRNWSSNLAAGTFLNTEDENVNYS